jgi:hypothetical protein
MTMNNPSRRDLSQLFTIRMWPERVDANRVEWRGKVRHVPSGQTRYFRDWTTLEQFLKRVLLDHQRPPAGPGGE